jgi:hypothetical protein
LRQGTARVDASTQQLAVQTSNSDKMSMPEACLTGQQFPGNDSKQVELPMDYTPLSHAYADIVVSSICFSLISIRFGNSYAHVTPVLWSRNLGRVELFGRAHQQRSTTLPGRSFSIRRKSEYTSYSNDALCLRSCKCEWAYLKMPSWDDKRGYAFPQYEAKAPQVGAAPRGFPTPQT